MMSRSSRNVEIGEIGEVKRLHRNVGPTVCVPGYIIESKKKVKG